MAIHVDPGSKLLGTPTHAGRPTIVTNKLSSLPVATSAPIAIAVHDPDGDDDIQSVALECPNATYELVDTGLGGDRVAGDNQYGGIAKIDTSVPAICKATVADRSALVVSESLTITGYVADAPVQVNEILPNPATGNNEFVELANTGSQAVPLFGWTLDDDPAGGSKPYLLDDWVIPANGYLVIDSAHSKLALNNTGDHVVLKSPTGQVKDDVAYGNASQAVSWGVVDGIWGWEHTSTPGFQNVADVAAGLQAGSSPQTIAAFTQLSPGEPVSLVGVVVALPNMLGSQYLLVSDGTGTAQIYHSTKAFPQLRLGDTVLASGTKSSTSYPRLIVASADDIASVPARSITANDLAAVLASKPSNDIYVSGDITLTKRNAKSLVGSIAGQLVTVVWADSLSELTFDPLLASGDSVQVLGILTNADTANPTLVICASSNLIATNHVSQVAAPTLVEPAVASPAPTLSRHSQTLALPKPIVRHTFDGLEALRLASQSLTLQLKVIAVQSALAEVSASVRVATIKRSFLGLLYGTIALLVSSVGVITLLHAPRELSSKLRTRANSAP